MRERYARRVAGEKEGVWRHCRDGMKLKSSNGFDVAFRGEVEFVEELRDAKSTVLLS
ncbi:hypothetical protein A2U01_0040273 [Trifolium medium]|uniref:Uncharacterized protein n=1 Tax=Trifolium medium TaxID=97028 RepID=A0A392Q4S8_9FABA|nr:hypothetical protein [Trifolium medium]